MKVEESRRDERLSKVDTTRIKGLLTRRTDRAKEVSGKLLSTVPSKLFRKIMACQECFDVESVMKSLIC